MDTLAALWDSLYDMEAPIAFFPVRHHSPACAVHLRRTLEAYRPDAILIEGPADSGHLIPHIGAPENEAPLCIYYSYHHKGKTADGEDDDFRSACYYPLLDFSPELAAIRYGVKNSVETRFIDLPYSQLALAERERRREDEGGKNSYYDDYYLARSRFIERLCEKQGCRHYGELWEKLFELGGPDMESGHFVRSVLALCHYSRVEYPTEMLEEEGCTAREAFMAAEIHRAGKEFGRVLVVTGGFHTAALAELIKTDVKPPKISAGKVEAYLIPYSFAESDQLAGYASGMPYPAFYQAVYERFEKSVEAAYDDAVLEFLARIGGALRKKKESTSIADEVAAVAQSRGLAALRDKPRQGVYELLDGVRSTYVKGEVNMSASVVFGVATELLRGDKMGNVSSGAEQVPLLLDFRETIRRLRLKTGMTTKQEVTLDILTKPVHREASAFFHRLEFLGVPFGELKFGPNYRRRDTSRVREKWVYASGARVEAAVIDVSYLGGTVREAASTMLARRKTAHTGCGDFSRLLIDAAVMDLTEHIAPLLEVVRESVVDDGSFLSLAQAAQNLLFLENARWLLSLPDMDFAGGLLGAVYHKAVALLPTLETAVEEEDRALAKTLKDLHQISRRDDIDPTLFEEALRDLCDRAEPTPPPCLQGGAAGLLYACDAIDTAAVLGYARSYLYGSGEQMKKSGRFLGGVFLTAWDILFEDRGFLEGISHVLEALPQEEFLALLPDLRLAFSTFTPTQLDRVGELVARLLSVDEMMLAKPAVSERVFALGRQLDAYAAAILGGGAANAG